VLEVPKDSFTVQQSRLGTLTALPLNVLASANALLFTVPVVVPLRHYWVIIGGGVNIIVDDTRLVPNNGVCTITPFNGTIELTAAGLTPGLTPWSVPLIINQQSTVNYWISINLQGVELSEGDQLGFQVTFTNTDAGAAHNVTTFSGAIRYRPVLLVTEPAVARLNDGRQDQLLDPRLRARRG
jgi:hypothetical protein